MTDVDFKLAAQILKWKDRPPMRTRVEKLMEAHLNDRKVFGLEMVCGLCRFLQKSEKSFTAANHLLCLSCYMTKGNLPKTINVERGAITEWRWPMSQTEFAELCGFAQPQLSRLETDAQRMRRGTAAKVARGLVCMARRGYSLRRALRDWPLFPMLLADGPLPLDAEDLHVLGSDGGDEQQSAVGHEAT